MSNAAPAWYNDPNDSTALRWWDGQQWTEHTAPREQAAAPPVSESHRPEPAVGQSAGSRKVPLFGARSAARDLAAENEQLRSALARVGALTLAEVEQQTTAARDQLMMLAEQIRQTEQRAAAAIAVVRPPA